ncbi:hypothetical protein [Pantoea sp. SO10]|nr:hypothetical protein [Pantoea sp. SO10]
MSIGEFYLSLVGIIKVAKMSLIAGGFIAVGCLVFKKIDEHNEKNNK